MVIARMICDVTGNSEASDAILIVLITVVFCVSDSTGDHVLLGERCIP